jgi:hypothetical protein
MKIDFTVSIGINNYSHQLSPLPIPKLFQCILQKQPRRKGRRAKGTRANFHVYRQSQAIRTIPVAAHERAKILKTGAWRRAVAL